jgi:hypothetical protein
VDIVAVALRRAEDVDGREEPGHESAQHPDGRPFLSLCNLHDYVERSDRVLARLEIVMFALDARATKIGEANNAQMYNLKAYPLIARSGM